MCEHTEGPLDVEIGENRTFHDTTRVAVTKTTNDGRRTETVAEVWPTPGSDQDIADGYLFAAAPKLLGAARQALQALEAIEGYEPEKNRLRKAIEASKPPTTTPERGTINGVDAFVTARELIEDGASTEYQRALVEFLGSAFGYRMEDYDAIKAELGIEDL